MNYKNNFKAKFGNDLNCRICDSHQDSQQEILICPILLSDIEVGDLTKSMCYDDIYDEVDKQITAVINWEKILKVRNKLIENI